MTLYDLPCHLNAFLFLLPFMPILHGEKNKLYASYVYPPVRADRPLGKGGGSPRCIPLFGLSPSVIECRTAAYLPFPAWQTPARRAALSRLRVAHPKGCLDSTSRPNGLRSPCGGKGDLGQTREGLRARLCKPAQR